MVSKAIKKHMLELIESKVSGVERIIEDEWLILRRNGPSRQAFILHPFKRTKKDYLNLMGQVTRAGYSSTDIFLQDGNIFFHRLDSRARGRVEASLKNYTTKELNSMLILRDIEKMSLKRNSNSLIYFHPESPRIPDCLRFYKMSSVIFDYTHLPLDDFARLKGDRVKSKSYVIPNEVKRLNFQN